MRCSSRWVAPWTSTSSTSQGVRPEEFKQKPQEFRHIKTQYGRDKSRTQNVLRLTKKVDVYWGPKYAKKNAEWQIFMNAENQLLYDNEIKIKASKKRKTYKNEGSPGGYVNYSVKVVVVNDNTED